MKLAMRTFMIFTLIMFGTEIYAQDLTYNPSEISPTGTTGYASSSSVFVFVVSDQVINIKDELEKIEITGIRKHALGDDIAKRIYLFEKTYTYMSNALPGAFSGKLVIQKPGIYNSILKLDKYITRQEKNGKISREQAIGELAQYLDKALMLYYENTSLLEEELKNADSTQALTFIYSTVKFL
jgi:hypothetical protein